MRFLYALLIVILIALFALPVLAQDAADVEAPAVVVPYGTEINEGVSNQLETLAESLFTLLWNAAYLPFAAPMVTVLVALSKRIPLNISSPVWAFLWTIVLWIAYLFATQIGYVNQFESAITGLATLGATFLGITLTPVGAKALYDYANKNNVPVVGFSKSPVNNPESPANQLLYAALSGAVADILKGNFANFSPSDEKVIISEAPAS